MIGRICPGCGKDWYSANTETWTCSACGARMTDEHNKPARKSDFFDLYVCDFCGALATYDGKTSLGPWAYMCEGHFEKVGIGLGLGRGQKLAKEGKTK